MFLSLFTKLQLLVIYSAGSVTLAALVKLVISGKFEHLHILKTTNYDVTLSYIKVTKLRRDCEIFILSLIFAEVHTTMSATLSLHGQ